MKISSVLILATFMITSQSFAGKNVVPHVDTVIEVQAANKNAHGYLAALGYALEEVRSDRAYIYGTQEDVKNIQAAGFKVDSYPIKKAWKNLKSADRRYTSYDGVIKKMNK